jgi:hypothetical protein
VSLPTASALDRAEACPGSMALPRVNVTSADSGTGTVVHHFALVRSREVGREAALAEITDRRDRDRCLALDLSGIPEGAQAEVALGWNHRTGEGRILGVNIGRSYPALGPDWFVGTIDLFGRTDRAVVVQDIKTGETKVSAAESMQLGFAALVGSVVTGLDEAEVAMLYAGHDGRLFHDRARLDALDLGRVAGRLRGIARAEAEAVEAVAAGRLPVLHDGPWCSLCPSQRFCPAQAAMVRTAAGWGVEQVGERMLALSDEEAGRAWEVLAVAEKVVEAGRKVLRQRAKQSPIPLPSGKVLAEVPWGTREEWSGPAMQMAAALKEELRAKGEISEVPATQVRAVSAKTAAKALPAAEKKGA